MEDENKEIADKSDPIIAGDEPEKHDVHAEGMDSNENISNTNFNNEFKSNEPGGDNIDKVKATELKSGKQILENSGKPETENTNVNEHNKGVNNVINKPTNIKNLSKSDHPTAAQHGPKYMTHSKKENTQKVAPFHANETHPKSIGDRKRVKFLVEENAKVPWNSNFQSTIPHVQKKDVIVVGKALISSRDSSVEKRRSGSKERTKRVVSKAKTEADDSGEEHWCKSNGDSTHRLKVNESKGSPQRSRGMEGMSKPMKKTVTPGREVPRRRAKQCPNVDKGGKASPVTQEQPKAAQQENKDEDASKAAATTPTDSAAPEQVPLETKYPQSLDMADMESSDSEEENLIQRSKGEEGGGHADLPAEHGDAERRPSQETPDDAKAAARPAESTDLQVSNASSTSVALGARASASGAVWREGLARLVDTFTHARYYRFTLCLGWLMWVAWILRLLGLTAFARFDVAGVVGSVGLLEFIGIVEVFGLLQVMMMLRAPAPPPTTSSSTTATAALVSSAAALIAQPHHMKARASAPALLSGGEGGAPPPRHLPAPKTGSLDFVCPARPRDTSLL